MLRRVLDVRPETRADLNAIAKHAWVTNGGALDPVDLGVNFGEEEADRSAKGNGASTSPRVSLDVSERDVADSISYERVRGFHDASVAKYRTFERGEFLIKQGERGDEMFVILSGEVEVVTARGAGDDDDDDDEVDMSDDIVAAAMMNREEDFEDSESSKSSSVRGENENATAGSLGGWLSCCFGSCGANRKRLNRKRPGAPRRARTRSSRRAAPATSWARCPC